ncbi:MAG TPA: PqqD family protein [Alloacidobacterium sp.]|nr:PqqD family protein [Alloacidobacterium sp.]
MAQDELHIRSVVDHDGAIILNIESDIFYSSNSTGAYIWSHLIRGEGVEQIARALADETGADFAVVLSDVQAFVADLKEKHLLRVEDRPSGPGRGERL